MFEKTYQPATDRAAHPRGVDAHRGLQGRPPHRAESLPYTIVIPPPNVTGSLHMGHALNNTLQDVVCRFECMRGKMCSWQPGTHHAGIATQLVVEWQMMERQEPDRRKIGRETFWRRCGRGRPAAPSSISSSGWAPPATGRESASPRTRASPRPSSRCSFDAQGLIYTRLVNWDPEFQSAISDLEVEMNPRSRAPSTGPPATPTSRLDVKALARGARPQSVGAPLSFQVPAEGRSRELHRRRDDAARDDARRHGGRRASGRCALQGHVRQAGEAASGRAAHPDRRRRYSDPEQGSGAVKITPVTTSTTTSRCATSWRSSTSSTPRRSSTRPIAGSTASRRAGASSPTSSRWGWSRRSRRTPTQSRMQRGNAVVEPWLTEQWYVNAAGALAKKADRPRSRTARPGSCRRTGRRPTSSGMRNIPWCISRQLWWGHQIPAWYAPDGKAFVAESEEAADAAAKKHYASSPSPLVGEGKGGGTAEHRREGISPHP